MAATMVPRQPHALGARVVGVAAKGYGSALDGGIRASLGEIIVFADADESYDFVEIGKFWCRLQQGADLVVGTRFARAYGIWTPARCRGPTVGWKRLLFRSSGACCSAPV
jgi:hypothetical protein